MATSQHVTFETSVGSFTVELYTTHAPKVCSAEEDPVQLTSQTCNNFAKLAERGYYNGVIVGVHMCC
jgi:peptidyl-prolyl cis-trans isomerase-like 1